MDENFFKTPKNPSVDLPTTREALCGHIFAMVRTLAPDRANHITGMVTHCRTEIEIKRLLEHPDLLKQCVNEAVEVLNRSVQHADAFATGVQPARSPVNSVTDINKALDPEKEEIGNRLFDKVAEIESELCAQITGMLLEMDVITLQQLLEDPVQLEVAVVKAKSEYLRERHPHTLPSRDELGEEIYEIAVQKYPAQAAKITGMLLELDEVRLQQLLDSPTELGRTINQAHEVLDSEKPH